MRKVFFISLFASVYTLIAQQNFDHIKMDKFLDALEQNHKAMGGIVLSKDGEIVYERYIGFAGVEANRKNTPHTIFKTGSITKTFTAVIFQQLIAEGKLTLETPLADFFPDIPNAEKITISHLLYQRTGLHNFTDDEAYLEYRSSYQSRENMLERFRKLEKEFEPGEKFEYSNTNYVLLGYIIEEITGKKYKEVLEERITSPLGLENTYYEGAIDPESYEAFSYRYYEDNWEKVPMEDMSVPHGAGSIVSTPRDLVRFIEALDQGKLTRTSSLEQMRDYQDGYGMGLFPLPFYDYIGYGHNGGIEGFQSNLVYFPGASLAMSCLFNGMNHNMNDILIGILSIYFGKKYEIPDLSAQPVELTEEDISRYVGDYTSDDMPLDIKIFVEDTQLYGQASGQPPFPLTPYSEKEFRFANAGIIILFDPEKDYQQFRLKQGGGNFLYKQE